VTGHLVVSCGVSWSRISPTSIISIRLEHRGRENGSMEAISVLRLKETIDARFSLNNCMMISLNEEAWDDNTFHRFKDEWS
jgi:hypothetical protein